MRQYLYTLLLFGCLFNPAFGANPPAENAVYHDNLKTVQLRRTGQLGAHRYIKLGRQNALTLSFDDFHADFKNYNYTFLHCNADWTPSDLIKSEYLKSYQQELIRNYNFSFNTYIPFTHYELSFPNQYIQFTKSGNYLLIVYLDDPAEPAFTLRFTVYEEMVNISTNTHRANTADKMNEYQQVDFSIFHGSYPIPTPFEDLKVVLLQNHRWDNAITGLKPRFLSNNTLNYDYDLENNFLGSNEFREFDTKDMRTLSLRVRKIDIDTSWIAYIQPEESRRFNQFITWEDLNGSYVIRKLDSEDPGTEADYILMDFYLKYPAPAPGGVFLFSEETNWVLDQNFALTYDYEEKAYRGQFYMKQGFHNYMYATMNADGSANTTPFEGNHWQTENEYTVLVYHREMGIRYDRCVGIATSNYIGD
ncbi:MAG: DUF5103 domain-containing protein [Flavobacteriia bacterium]|nr:DUF5103 domain-containing protein [Flavobacteriia bacterium]